MKICVITGTQVKGCTYHIKEMFLENLPGEHDVVQYYLPEDFPHFCVGCKNCFSEGEAYCPHANDSLKIWQSFIDADILVFAYPVYVMRVPGQLKALLDHFGCHWMVHRPKSEMFHKTAVIITQSIGAPNGGAQKDVITSLNWLGVSRIKTISFKMIEGVVWPELSEKKREQIGEQIARFAQSIPQTKPSKMSLKVKGYFKIAQAMQKSLRKKGIQSLDNTYWQEQGWLD